MAVDTIFLLPKASLAEDQSNMQRISAYTSARSHCSPNKAVLSKRLNADQVSNVYDKTELAVVYCVNQQGDVVSTKIMPGY